MASSKIIDGVFNFNNESNIFDLMSKLIIISSVLESKSFKFSMSSSLNSRMANLVAEDISSEAYF